MERQDPELPLEIWNEIAHWVVGTDVWTTLAMSRICHVWRDLVLAIPWTFHGYLSTRLLTFLPLQQPPEAFFMTSLCPPDFPHEFPGRECNIRLLKWVETQHIHKLRLHITVDTPLKASEDIKKLFDIFYARGVRDLLIRGRTKELPGARYITCGCWYQRDWRGPEGETGRLVLKNMGSQDMYALSQALNPGYLIIHDASIDSREFWRQPPPPDVRILGLCERSELYNLCPSFPISVREVRILRSDPLSSNESERYGVFRGGYPLEGYSKNRVPSVRILRGAVFPRDSKDMLTTFPNLESLSVDCRVPVRTKDERDILRATHQDPRTVPFLPRIHPSRSCYPRCLQHRYVYPSTSHRCSRHPAFHTSFPESPESPSPHTSLHPHVHPQDLPTKNKLPEGAIYSNR